MLLRWAMNVNGVCHLDISLIRLGLGNYKKIIHVYRKVYYK